MKTEIFKEDLSGAAELIRKGSLVAVPTETVYGLAGNGLNERAVKDIYEVKGRPPVKPLSLMVPSPDEMEKYCETVPKAAKDLAERFWPGPLTIVLNSKDIVPEIVRAGGKTVGLRCPDHEKTLELLRLAGLPFAAPSANPSGAESPKSAEKVKEYFDGKIGGIVDGGACSIGKESTLIDMSKTPYKILRQGALSAEEIADALCGEMTIVGITGGTGCGKTTGLKVLQEQGALVIDCDRVYHELLVSSEDMLHEIGERFPGSFIEGVFDRKALGSIVFSDEEALKDLNKITHKYVDMEVKRLLRLHAMEGGKMAVIDAIELISSGLSDNCSFTVGVTASDETRISRIMQRDNISREYAEMRVKAQKPMSYFEENCDYTIANDSSKEDFIYKFKTLIEEANKNGRKK